MIDPMDELTAVLEAPQDDAPRLRLADQLISRGDPRGEFIRLQVERARLAPFSDEAARRRTPRAALQRDRQQRIEARAVGLGAI